MCSRGKFSFDLNELPVEDDEDNENDRIICSQPSKAVPSVNLIPSELFVNSAAPQEIVNNHAFSHASSVSGFRPFVRPKPFHGPEVGIVEPKREEDLPKVEVGVVEPKREEDLPKVESSLPTKSNTCEEIKPGSSIVRGSSDAQKVEKEEGECVDAEPETTVNKYSNCSLDENSKASQRKEMAQRIACSAFLLALDDDKVVENDTCTPTVDKVAKQSSKKSSSSHNSESSSKEDMLIDGKEEPYSLAKQKDIKGVEAGHTLKCANPVGKKKIDQQKEVMLGKKRSRQTMFLDLDDVKQAGSIKISLPRRQNFPPPIATRTVKDARSIPSSVERIGEKLQSVNKDQQQVDIPFGEGGNSTESLRSECNGDTYSGALNRSRRLNGDTDIGAEVPEPFLSRQGSRKLPADSRQLRNTQFSNRKSAFTSQSSMDPKSGNKKFITSKRSTMASNQYQDTSVERLIREVTSEKFWNHPEDTELQSVPGRFESSEEYVRLFEPLLFEECRAQLYSSWEELAETNGRLKVRVKSVERRERGWYDVIVLPVSEFKWTFKEGDVAALSNIPNSDEEPEVTGCVAGTVRRHIPLDTRDPLGAILHFYVGEIFDTCSKIDDDHILRKLQPKDIWHLTILGSLATTQREYVALHAFSRLNSQMRNAILNPSPDQFPDYEKQTPAIPECFTQNFIEHLNRSFNAPQLAAIQWAAMHTAAGTNSAMLKRQDPWPFTLVQGPPGTGKTHTVWGMLNVIHLVQYQHYYTALLKKLAPESYKQATESNLDNVVSGSIDEVLQNMDQNLYRTLPKLCPKPRMLVCAPSNAATDELLARVLDRGFIDGEMKVYRPDVARVGVDTQTRAAQAVSVERRTEQLLSRPRDEILGHMHNLKQRESMLSQQIAGLQRGLSVAAAASRSQGSVGMDPDLLIERDQNRDMLLQNLAAVVETRDKVLVEMSRLIIVEGKFRPGYNFNLEEARGSLEASFANEAEIVFTTVSSSGRKLFSRLSHGFDMVVIDEAAQASEVGVLPPLSLGAARCVLVGDPQQLPATVISKAAGTLLYSRSLFERFQQAGCPTLLLTVQYRMHPQIRDFPSKYFYQGRLTDSETISSLPDEVYYKDLMLRPYVFFNISRGRESHRGGSVSYENIDEARFGVGLYMHLQKALKSLGAAKVSVGIITPYKLQLKCLKYEFGNLLSQEELKDMYINTVDAFQGQERDVIIMSCVRASSHGVGFVADIRRMNVALTRAKRALWVMGNANALMQCDDWAALISDAKARNCFMDMTSIPKEFPMPKGPSNPLGRVHSNKRGFRSAVPRRRASFDPHLDSRSGTPSEDDEKFNKSINSRNENYRPSKPPVENFLDDVDKAGDKYRGNWQHGVPKKQSSSRLVGKRDS